MGVAWLNGLKLPAGGHLHSMVCFRLFSSPFNAITQYLSFHDQRFSGNISFALGGVKGSVYILSSKATHLTSDSRGGVALLLILLLWYSIFSH